MWSMCVLPHLTTTLCTDRPGCGRTCPRQSVMQTCRQSRTALISAAASPHTQPASIPAITKTAVNPGSPCFAALAVVPSAAGAVAVAAAGLFVGAGVTRSPGGASVAVAVADGADAFVAVTAGVGVSNHPGGYVPLPPLPPDGVGVAASVPASRNMLHPFSRIFLVPVAFFTKFKVNSPLSRYASICSMMYLASSSSSMHSAMLTFSPSAPSKFRILTHRPASSSG